MQIKVEGRAMRVAVVGAGGRTGRLVVEQAIARGDEAIAIVRKPEAHAFSSPGVHVRRADVRDAEALERALAGADVVVSTLGVARSRPPTDVYSSGSGNTLRAMAANGIGTLAVISAAPAGPRDEQPFLQRRVAMPILERFFGGAYDDMRRMETVLSGSESAWVALRPPRLVSRAPTGAYRIDQRPLRKARVLSFADLATALLDVIADASRFHRAWYVAN